MRAALILLIGLGLSCVYEPVEIARFEAGDGEDTSVNESFGSQHVEWTEAQLRDGVTVLASLGAIDVEMLALGDGTHHVVIELLPMEPATLSPDFIATLDRVDAEPIESGQADDPFEPSGAGLRYEGELQLGWRLVLHADEQRDVEVRAWIVAP